MPAVYSVFNIGTGHSRIETNNTIANLWRSCNGQDKRDKWVNDGPGVHWYDLLGTAAGQGMDPKRRETVQAILKADPQKVNLTGHSRGAILCHMIANDLAERGFSGEINMIVVDPVHMSTSHKGRAGTFDKRMTLGAYVAIVMENVTKSIFPLTAVSADTKLRNQMCVINMPGSHGSGTQDQTSAIGATVSAMIKYYMSAWGTDFNTRAPLPVEIVDLFARIRSENPVHYSKKGLVTERWITDDKKGMGHIAKQAYQKLGRKDTITKMLASGSIFGGGQKATDLRDSPYFFNEFHMWCFRCAYPAITDFFEGKRPDPRILDAEVDAIEHYHKDTWKSLKNLGMV